ncbi:nickel pincer cofactor biosynthesis protein LarC [Ornithinimicrobium sufpigmenti]|uniref:nickel pincer cofactor biosynthesis protein LarC n=1 Tax=Ornithinimicrobium sufpigmenti TaxID=2508882 RepID=UPI0010369A4B|nr:MULTISPECIES: nickel pincer cofactor biosynthesis protein LarC [unclassified Ornithinimicrobium]
MPSLWIDASAGVAGDMLLAALLEAGADLEVVRAAVAAVVPGEVRIETAPVRRAGLAATRCTVTPDAPAGHHRPWTEISALLRDAALAQPVRDLAYAAFLALARAESAAHGVPEEEVRFHEVGAWDSIADVVGVAAAVHDLGVTRTSATPVGLGSGTVDTAHGRMPVPVPAVVRLLADGPLTAAPDDGLVGECATPTGVAMMVALAPHVAPTPAGRVQAVGVGAGGRDTAGRANVVRVVLHEDVDGAHRHRDGGLESRPWGEHWSEHGSERGNGQEGERPAGSGQEGSEHDHEQTLVELAANVDDLDPRVWPSVIETVLAAGALDAWLVPVHMKKGRPGVIVHALAEPHLRAGLVEVLVRHTPSLGVRWHLVTRAALGRRWERVEVPGGSVRVKLGLREGEVVTATPELEDARMVAEATGQPLRAVLRAAEAAAAGAAWSTDPPAQG